MIVEPKAEASVLLPWVATNSPCLPSPFELLEHVKSAWLSGSDPAVVYVVAGVHCDIPSATRLAVVAMVVVLSPGGRMVDSAGRIVEEVLLDASTTLS